MLRTRRFGSLLMALGCAAIAACGGSPTAPSDNGPRVTSVTPAEGTTFGGLTVTIAGSGFAAGATVSIGGAPATAVVVQDAGTITATTPAHSAGKADVVVTVSGKNGTLPGGFTYAAPSVQNQPPQLTSLTVQGTRPNEPAGYADLDEAVSVTANVTDAETPIDQLDFQWSAPAGAISGSGSRIVFTAPHAAGTVVLQLTITERYTAPDASGLPVQKQNVTTGTATVNVHDGAGEVGAMARDFLVKFSQSSIAPDDVMVNFKDGCGVNGTGRRDELAQVVANRKNFTIQPGWSVGSPRTTISFGGTSPFRARHADAWSSLDVQWTSTCKVNDPSVGCPSIGYVRTDAGIDWVTAAFDRPTNRWWLCDSDYESTINTTHRYLR